MPTGYSDEGNTLVERPSPQVSSSCEIDEKKISQHISVHPCLIKSTLSSTKKRSSTEINAKGKDSLSLCHSVWLRMENTAPFHVGFHGLLNFFFSLLVLLKCHCLQPKPTFWLNHFVIYSLKAETFTNVQLGVFNHTLQWLVSHLGLSQWDIRKQWSPRVMHHSSVKLRYNREQDR